ncbi:Uncharacterised protein [Moraxella lacunata]|uniref:Uncharacterized protein n=1 Tax=Moraxella lacunata TaxID=477 RepID=A0A378TTR6_MORLA|nr:Uncharacterised protein [Moraxella lacunata]
MKKNYGSGLKKYAELDFPFALSLPAGRKTVRFPKLTTNGFLCSILFKPEPKLFFAP